MRYILDSNILINIIRGHQNIDLDLQKFGVYDFNTSFISIVSVGEVLSISKQNNWGIPKKNLFEGLIKTFKPYPIVSRQLLDIYAEIDAFSKGKPTTIPIPQGWSSRTMGKNDLWIAATTHLAQATLITTDADFDHLNGLYFPVIKLSVKV